MTSKGWEEHLILNPYNLLWVLVPYSGSWLSVLTTPCLPLHLWNFNAFRLIVLLPHHTNYLPLLFLLFITFVLLLSTVYLDTFKSAGDAISSQLMSSAASAECREEIHGKM